MSLDLSGRWEASGYQCPWGTFHTEVVEVAHEGEQIVAVKIIGDDCVPAGFETFRGRLPTGASVGAITWTVGQPRAPASGQVPGFLRVLDENRFVAGDESGGDLVFRRQGY